MHTLSCSLRITPCFAGIYENHQQAELDSYINEMKTERGSMYSCVECGKTTKSRGDLKKHILSKHIQGPPLVCPYCARPYKNQPSLQAHISQSHREGGRNQQ
jgi:uncharacterized Zn-finger protein